MIAKTSSGQSFHALANYLVNGRSGDEPERVAWTAGRNLGTDDPRLAADLMRATAMQNVRVEQPVYHLSISFDPSDAVTPELMQQAADRVLRDLGLDQHQAVMVRHQDRAHPHVHVMVNRVHPETGAAWERWQDRPRIEQALRETERELGLRQVPGRLHQLDGQEAPERSHLTDGERHVAARTGEAPFAERVREHAAEYRSARSWEELTGRLAAHGLRLEAKGQGFVITDGEHYVKASRVARELSRARLEARFGRSPDLAPGLAAERRAREPLSPAVADVAEAVREQERIERLMDERRQVQGDLATYRSRIYEIDRATHLLQAANEQFGRALARVYRDPEAAQEAYRKTAAQEGAEAAQARLRDQPYSFGALRTVQQTRAWGLLLVDDDTAARQAARAAVYEAGQLAGAERRLTGLVGEHVTHAERRLSDALGRIYVDPAPARAAFEQAAATVGPAEAARTLVDHPEQFGAVRAADAPGGRPDLLERGALAEQARDAVEARALTSAALVRGYTVEAVRRTEQHAGIIGRATDREPSADLLSRSIHRAVKQLAPGELAQLRAVLTAPQAAIAFRARQAVRDVVLGRDEERELGR